MLLVVELTIRPGAQREMREALDRLVDATRQEPGVMRFEVGLDPGDETRVPLRDRRFRYAGRSAARLVLLAGQDWGGSAAFAFAAAHPDDVRRLAVLESMPAGPWTETAPGRGDAWFVGFHQIPDLPEHMVAGRERVYLEWFLRAFSATPGVPAPTAVEEYVRCCGRKNSPVC